MFRGRVPKEGEPHWTGDDRKWALAWQHDQDSKLPCGCYPDETTGTENAGRFTAIPTRCHRHDAIGQAAELRAKNDGPADSRHGLLWVTEKVD